MHEHRQELLAREAEQYRQRGQILSSEQRNMRLYNTWFFYLMVPIVFGLSLLFHQCWSASPPVTP